MTCLSFKRILRGGFALCMLLGLLAINQLGTSSVAHAAPAVAGNNFLQIDPNNRHHLIYQGKQITLKGTNLEGDKQSSDSIWLSYDANYINGLLNQAQSLGINSVRVTFPDTATQNRVPLWNNTDLQHLDNLLDNMNSRGMGAIITLFNRHQYGTADRNQDHAWIHKIMNYVPATIGVAFKNDPRVLMWDIANEPPMNTANIDWLRDMRTYIANEGPKQLVTVGFDNQYSAQIAHDNDPNNVAIRANDVLSVHCYARYAGDVGPLANGGKADGVDYRTYTYCGGVMDLIKKFYPNQPILMEEFGWEDAPANGEDPNGPWQFSYVNVNAFLRTPVCVSDLYNQVLNVAIPHSDSVGAVEWSLQDYNGNGSNFGLLDVNQQPKNPAVGGGACNPISGYQGPNYDNNTRFPVPAASGYTLFKNWNPSGLARPFRLEVFRLYNGSTGEHFYTIDPAEATSLKNSGWSLEKTHAWAVSDSPGSGLVALYRCYLPSYKKHLYTVKADCEGQTYESVLGYIAQSQGSGGTPTQGTTALYRLLRSNPFDHLYTADAGESNDAQTRYGYTSEGITGYVWP